jgi:ankyrin repeat protein
MYETLMVALKNNLYEVLDNLFKNRNFLLYLPRIINKENEKGFTPLDLAVLNNNNKFIDKLIENGADVLHKINNKHYNYHIQDLRMNAKVKYLIEQHYIRKFNLKYPN